MGRDHSHYVIIGGSAAGMSAAEGIREIDPEGVITVLSEEPDMPYFRPLIPFVISGKKQPADLAVIGQGPYRGVRVDVRLNTRAETVDTRNQTVTVTGGEAVSYDRLLIATGSRPYIPPEIEGTDADGVFALRTLADARAAEKRVAKTRHAVMLGGGLLNLKAAFALLERKLEVSLVVYSPEILSQLMEPADAGLLRDALNRAGLNILTGCSATRILSGTDGVSGVLLDNGKEIPCQMVCIGKGVLPNVEFLEDSGIRLDGGAVVDRYAAASVDNVFAAGDVAVTFDPITGERIVTGLWTNAVEMGRCAGYNMAGRTTEYSGTFGILNATQVAEEPFVSMGIVHTAGTDNEVHVISKSGAYRKLVFTPDGKRLIGAVFIGDITNAGLYRYVIRERMPVDRIKSYIIRQTLHYGHFIA